MLVLNIQDQMHGTAKTGGKNTPTPSNEVGLSRREWLFTDIERSGVRKRHLARKNLERSGNA